MLPVVVIASLMTLQQAVAGSFSSSNADLLTSSAGTVLRDVGNAQSHGHEEALQAYVLALSNLARASHSDTILTLARQLNATLDFSHHFRQLSEAEAEGGEEETCPPCNCPPMAPSPPDNPPSPSAPPDPPANPPPSPNAPPQPSFVGYWVTIIIAGTIAGPTLCLALVLYFAD